MFYVHILDNCKVPALLDINLQCILAILFFKDGCFFQPGNIGICTDPCSVDERELFVCLDGLLDLSKEGVWPEVDRGHQLCGFWRKFASCCFANFHGLFHMARLSIVLLVIIPILLPLHRLT